MTFDLPTVGGDDDEWGTELNEDLTLLKAEADAAEPASQLTSDISALQAEADAAEPASDLALQLRNIDAVVRYATTQPTRATATPDVLRRVRWVTASAPSISAGYAIEGDVWEQTS